MTGGEAAAAASWATGAVGRVAPVAGLKAAVHDWEVKSHTLTLPSCEGEVAEGGSFGLLLF